MHSWTGVSSSSFKTALKIPLATKRRLERYAFMRTNRVVSWKCWKNVEHSTRPIASTQVSLIIAWWRYTPARRRWWDCQSSTQVWNSSPAHKSCRSWGQLGRNIDLTRWNLIASKISHRHRPPCRQPCSLENGAPGLIPASWGDSDKILSDNTPAGHPQVQTWWSAGSSCWILMNLLKG